MTDAMRKRLFGVVAILVAAIGLGIVMFADLGENLVYYWSPTELRAQENAGEATVRLGGLVVPGSIDHDPGASTLRFEVTDGTTTVSVHSDGNPPQMFREGIGVVVEGQLQPDGVFHTDRVMVKHSNEYEAPGEGEHHNPYQTLAEAE